MKAYPEQPSGSVGLVLIKRGFAGSSVETLKAFARRDEQMAANQKKGTKFFI